MTESAVPRQDSSPPNYGGERPSQFMVVAEQDGHATTGHPNIIVPKDQYAQVWNLRAHAQPTHCPKCGKTSLTRVEFKVGHHTHLMAAIFTTFLCCIIPYLTTAWKDRLHFCGSCGTLLAIWHASERLEIIAKDGEGTDTATTGAPAQGPVKA